MLKSRYWGFWYLSISLGFLLLAITHLLRGDRVAEIALRIFVAIGFALLALFQFRRK